MRTRLNAFLRANEHRIYDLGIWDCAVFAFDAVEAMTGTDHLAVYRGKYSTYSEAEALMRETDRVATLRSLVTKKLGEPIPIAMARTGDLVSHGPSIGILYAGRGIFLAEHQGYERLPRASLDRAWSVRG
jgi:hypothetical protein